MTDFNTFITNLSKRNHQGLFKMMRQVKIPQTLPPKNHIHKKQ